uniref:Uncharacterized protein LOC101493397 n=1 Tax=Cicer arietinum TaxID=3827 RepID=A0A3Q7YB86_CICAR|nr:uncharacterized protein LOC101493397 [Cicer arietinum]
MVSNRRREKSHQLKTIEKTLNLKCLISILFLTFVIKGSCEDSCPLKSLNTVQTKTGKVIQGKPEWNVLVTNNCICSQSQIKLACKGFQSVQKIDPLILSKNGDNCLLSNGHILVDSDREAFTYAWDTPYLFIPISSITGPPCNRH